MNSFVPLSVPSFMGRELEYVTEAITTGWVSTAGNYVTMFEEQFAKYAKTDKAVACQSGTAALHLAFIACGIGVGDLVIAPTLTFIASINPISYVGAAPIFMDCDDFLCLDVDKIEKYLLKECINLNGTMYDIKTNKPVKAILAVHVFGNCVDMERLMLVAREYGLLVIEDAAEAVGSFFSSGIYSGCMAGTIGDIGIYSFNGNKIMTTGGGGMIVSRDTAKIERVKHLSTQAKANELYFEHDEIGYNYRMTNLQAALGVAQLEQLEGFIKIKKNNYFEYKNLGVSLLAFNENIRPNYWFFSHITEYRDDLIHYLAENKIQARPIWKLNHLHDMYKNCSTYDIKNAIMYYEKIVNIPCSSNLNNDELKYVAYIIKQYT